MESNIFEDLFEVGELKFGINDDGSAYCHVVTVAEKENKRAEELIEIILNYVSENCLSNSQACVVLKRVIGILEPKLSCDRQGNVSLEEIQRVKELSVGNIKSDKITVGSGGGVGDGK